MLVDYHIHTCYSADSKAPVKAQLDAAAAAGLTHICLTDHVDFDGSPLEPADLAARNEEIASLASSYPSLDISFGMELGMANHDSSRLAYEYAKDIHIDFVIGSVHLVDGIDAYYPEFFEGRTREQAYGCYLEKLAQTIKVTDFSVMGHYDFCTKYSPYSDRPLRYRMFPELFDDIFRFLIKNGRSMEINSSAWRNDPSWGLDIYSRFRELGGEYVTIGADAHKPEKVGNRVKEAMELAKAAGIKYIATFKDMKPILHKI